MNWIGLDCVLSICLPLDSGSRKMGGWRGEGWRGEGGGMGSKARYTGEANMNTKMEGGRCFDLSFASPVPGRAICDAMDRTF